MPAQLFLIVPPELDPARLASVLAEGEVAALLLQRGTQAENGYKSWVKAVVPIAQAAGCAALIEGEPGWVRVLGADGIQVSGSLDDVREAVDALKPGLIVGATATQSRHEAMSRGELDIDYLLFGPLGGALDPADRENAQWWAEVMEVPAVLSDPGADPETVDPQGCEFLALSDSLWNTAEDPAERVGAFARRLESL